VKWIKKIIIFVVVFVLGLALGGFVFGTMAAGGLPLFYSSSLTEMAIDAQQIAAGEHLAVLERKSNALPFLTLSYYNTFYKALPDDNTRLNPLWQVKKYYEISGEPVPSEIKDILDSLPPIPLTSCEIKRLEQSKNGILQD
jgi:hypothetical protein